MQEFALVDALMKYISFYTHHNTYNTYRLSVLYKLTQLATHMNIKVTSNMLLSRSQSNCSIFAINAGVSGCGKTRSIEKLDELTKEAEKNVVKLISALEKERLEEIANELASYKPHHTDYKKMVKSKLIALNNRYNFVPKISNATVPALRELVKATYIHGLGSINYEVDEFTGTLNNGDQKEVANEFLQLYDGKMSNKLLKYGSQEKQEEVRLDNLTPTVSANYYLTGTYNKIHNEEAVGNQLITFLTDGAARRGIFAFTSEEDRDPIPYELDYEYAQQIDSLKQQYSQWFASLININNLNKVINIPDDIDLELYNYSKECQKEAQDISDNIPNANILKIELQARPYKIARLSAVLSFVQGFKEVDIQSYQYAKYCVELSSEALKKLINIDPPYVRLAKYLMSSNQEISVNQLLGLPDMKDPNNIKNKLFEAASSYAYDNNYLLHYIQRQESDTTLTYYKSTKLEINEFSTFEPIVSYTKYSPEQHIYGDTIISTKNNNLTLDRLINMVKCKDLAFTTHYSANGERKESQCENGFNLIVLDIDGTCNIETAKVMLSNYNNIIYTTKSHLKSKNGKEPAHHYRIILPIVRTLFLDKESYSELMNNIYKEFWFLKPDTSTKDRLRLWATNSEAEIFSNLSNELELFPAHRYINQPKSYKIDKKQSVEFYKHKLKSFYLDESVGRNNTLYAYAMLCKDSGITNKEIIKNVLEANSKFSQPLGEDELFSTVLREFK